MNATTNDANDFNVDIHDFGPDDCTACDLHRDPARPGHACLSHTCPDCGRPTHALLNDARELIHRCPAGTVLNAGA